MIRVLRETYRTPRDVAERVARAGGSNPYGEPNFRVVWGGSRLTWIGGKWVDYDASGNALRSVIELRREPKYLPAERWHIERWTPPEGYGSPRTWWLQTTETVDGIRIPALGPYPARGDYEHCFTVEDAGGEFLPLNPMACEWIVRAIEWSRRQPRRMKRAALYARAEREELAQSLKDDQALGLVFDEANLKGSAMVTVS